MKGTMRLTKEDIDRMLAWEKRERRRGPGKPYVVCHASEVELWRKALGPGIRVYSFLEIRPRSSNGRAGDL